MQWSHANQLFTRVMMVTIERCANYTQDFCSDEFERETAIFPEHDMWLLVERRDWSCRDHSTSNSSHFSSCTECLPLPGNLHPLKLGSSPTSLRKTLITTTHLPFSELILQSLLFGLVSVQYFIVSYIFVSQIH